MGRKKKSNQKKANDARGYFQGGKQQPIPKSSTAFNKKGAATTSVSSKTHNDIQVLIGQLKDENDESTNKASAQSNKIAPSDRFISRLTTTVDRLEELGFTDAQIDRAVEELQYDFDTEKALDWLCLNFNTLELPPLFTDGRIRDSLSTVTTSETITVLKAPPISTATTKNTSREESILTHSNLKESDTSDRKEKEEREKESLEEAKRKEWLLKQYQYEEDEEDDVKEEQETKEGTLTNAAMIQEKAILTPEEEHLKEEESKLKEMEADLMNDANNYMRSKQEIKQLQIQVKKQKQQVAGLKRKIEKAKAKERRLQQEQEEQEQAKTSQNVEEVEEEDMGGGFFDMFAQDDEKEESETGEETPVIKSVPLLDYSIPKGWTGTTPEKTLDQVCKKQKLLKPKYTKLPQNRGFRLSVTMTKKKNKTPRTWEANQCDFTITSSLKDYLATQALYEMDSTVPLYGMFPPAFRDLWLSWLRKKQEEKEQVQKDKDSAKQLRIDNLVSMIFNLQQCKIHDTSKVKSTTSSKENIQVKESELDHHWEDLKVMDFPVRATPSDLGIKMKENFDHKQNSQAYQKLKEIRNNLPMASYRQQVLEMVHRNAVTILCAETGAGKTTQCPQYILEEAILNGIGDQAQILCTQPRRVAATSVAERVAEEMCETLGKMVGYQIRMESKRSAQTRLLFCTTGVVLRRLQEDSKLKGVTHVIVDEVHERQQQTDVLLVILKQLLRTTRPDLKVILMSATMDSQLFGSFFDGAPMIRIPGRTFPVSNYFLEDLMDATDHVIEEGSRYAERQYRNEEKASLWVTTRGGEKRREMFDLVSQVDLAEVTMYPGYKMATRRSMERVNEEIINYDLIEDVLILLLINQESNTSLLAPDGADLSNGSILIFLPGLGEIRAMTEQLEGNRHLGNKQRFEIIPMHSTLSSRDQRKAFAPAKSGSRKIILSTNIAETSVTLPDVICVIDSGRVREIRRNKRTSTSILATDWCSKASAKQRAGRAGRVQAGLCLKLFSSTTAERIMKPTSEPELRRVPLEEVCLSILASGFATSCLKFLNQAPQPPSPESVEAAIGVLLDVGAIDRATDNDSEVKEQPERLTPLGHHLAKLPVDVRLGKMLIFGSLFHCIDPVLTIAASLSSKSPFSNFVNDTSIAKAKQKAFVDTESDFMTYCRVWDAYCKAASISPSVGRKFCRENYLNYTALREIGDARRHFLELLCRIGFVDYNEVKNLDWKTVKESSFSKHANKPELVHAVICAGLYPNVACLEQPAIGDYTMWHKAERLYFHSTSVNASKKRYSSSDKWVCFFEKFGTPNRTSVSTTCFLHPFALLLFGGGIDVRYTDRIVMVDEWIQIEMAAQMGVILRELRKQVEILLQKKIREADVSEQEGFGSDMVEGIINILVA